MRCTPLLSTSHGRTLLSSWARRRTSARWTSSPSGVGCGAASAAHQSASGNGLSRSCHEKARRMWYAATASPAKCSIHATRWATSKVCMLACQHASNQPNQQANCERCQMRSQQLSQRVRLAAHQLQATACGPTKRVCRYAGRRVVACAFKHSLAGWQLCRRQLPVLLLLCRGTCACATCRRAVHTLTIPVIIVHHWLCSSHHSACR